MEQRPRRNRKTQSIRNALRETILLPQHLIYPLFVIDGKGSPEPIDSMPNCFRYTEENVISEIESALKLGISQVVLFPAVSDSLKNPTASYGFSTENFYLRIASRLKREFGEDLHLISDVALDPYSSDGHDGLVKDNQILNDETLPILAKLAVAQASAGFDTIGPSDMMDGRVAYLRKSLDQAGYFNTGIISYTAKYASAFYGPFRDALDSTPKSGDKKTYQMDPANSREALREAELDMMEGADILMIKPALSYLDIISQMKNSTNLPIAAYNVSGEYSMIKAATQKGWLDEKQIVDEILLSIRRAGANLILTYFAKDWAQNFKNKT